jgi:hypothetical protein
MSERPNASAPNRNAPARHTRVPVPEPLRNALLQFQSMDRNQDGILTGDELVAHSQIVRANHSLMLQGEPPVPLPEGRTTELNPVIRALRSQLVGVTVTNHGLQPPASHHGAPEAPNAIEQDLTSLLSGLAQRNPLAAQALARIIGDRQREMRQDEKVVTREEQSMLRAIRSGAADELLRRIPRVAADISAQQIIDATAIHPDFHPSMPSDPFEGEVFRGPYRGTPVEPKNPVRRG